MSTLLAQTQPSRAMPELKEYMTSEEAAERLGYHIIYVRQMMREHKLRGVKIGGRTWLILRKSVDEYMRATGGMSKHDPRRSRN